MKTLSQMTAEERQYFLSNSARIADEEDQLEVESRLAQYEPRRFNENSVTYDDCEDELDEITEEDTIIACKTILELIQ